MADAFSARFGRGAAACVRRPSAQAAAGLLLFSLCCHFSVLFSNCLFAVAGTDSTLQMMYFIPFLQKSFLSGQPFWSWSSGLGGDVFGQFSYYYTTSPCFYLMLLLRRLGIGSWTLANTLQWKLAFSIFKQFLSMFFMYLLLRREGRKQYSSLIGAMTYGGCLCYMYFSLSFDFMTDAYLWPPLAVWGLYQYRKTGGKRLFVAAAALCAANSFYFGYISFILFALAVLVFYDWRGSGAREKLRLFMRSMAGYALLFLTALGLSAAAFLPAVCSFLKTDRFSNPVSYPLFYSSGYLLSLPEKLFSNISLFGFPAIALVVFALPWGKLSAETKRKTVLAGILFLLYLIPFSGSFFNGFSYYCERWYYLLIFAVAYALPNWLEENEAHRAAGARFLAVFTILAVLLFYTRKDRGASFARVPSGREFICLLAAVLSLLLLSLLRSVHKKRARAALKAALTVCTAAALAVNTATYLFLRKPDVTAESLQNAGMQSPELTRLFSSLTPGENEFYRTVFRGNEAENAPLVYGYYGASTYNSMVDGALHKWIKRDFNIHASLMEPSRYENFDDRLFLESAFGVRYLVSPKSDPVAAYGYRLVKQTAGYLVYENQYPAGLGLWYSSATVRETDQGGSVALRDALLLQSAVVDRAVPGLSSPKPDTVTSVLEADFAGLSGKNASVGGGTVTAGKDASIRIPIKNTHSDEPGEILVSFRLDSEAGRAYTLSVNGKTTQKSNETDFYTYPLNRYTFRLDGGTTALEISLSPGRYTFRDFSVSFNSYRNYASWVAQRNKYKLENLSVNGGKVSGTIRNGEKGILALSIPYSGGWSAKVDGKRQQIIRVNGVFSGLVLEPGSHKIELSYLTPWLVPGIFVTAATGLGILAFCLVKRKKGKRPLSRKSARSAAGNSLLP